MIHATCERLGAGPWAEPVNALTNLAFVLAALLLWRRTAGDGLARGLCWVLLLIGAGSALFHTVATPWAALLDVLPIAGFVLLYAFAAHRRFWGQGRGASLLFAALTIPWVALLAPLAARVPGLEVSAIYWPIPALILLHAFLLRERRPEVAPGLALGGLVLCVSLVLRSLDGALCATFPLGTHWAWHLLNALMLGSMVATLLRASRLDAGGHGR